ncbi:MAG: TlpA family protein disulfide reductase [Chloroflexi bacterium]|nr:MAG: TlpA family protein disulfide reductase [Chloroflexota bacterium]
MENVRRSRKARKQNEAKITAMFLIGALLLVFGVIGIILLSGNSQASSEFENTPAEVSYPAPEINLVDLEGNSVSLEDYLGKTVMVNNWATWCPPCKAEMPDLDRYYQTHKDEDFILIGIEAGDTEANVSSFVQSYGINFPIWLDAKQEAVQAFRNNGLPNSYIIDTSGTIRIVWNGAVTLKQLEKYVTPLLED